MSTEIVHVEWYTRILDGTRHADNVPRAAEHVFPSEEEAVEFSRNNGGLTPGTAFMRVRHGVRL